MADSDWLIETFRFSTDTELEAKSRDIVGPVPWHRRMAQW